MSNLDIYGAVAAVPSNAQKPIEGGRLKGKTDINPMWRIKALTEMFGPCGFGWKYVITKQWLEQGHGGEIAAFCNIDLFVKYEGEWSEAIPGTGGSALVAQERNGLYTSDECYKMALTDAISVACKALGFGADIYWAQGRTKYDQPHETATKGRTSTKKVEQDDQLGIAIDDLKRTKNRKELIAANNKWAGIYGENDKYNAVLAEMCKKYPKQQ